MTIALSMLAERFLSVAPSTNGDLTVRWYRDAHDAEGDDVRIESLGATGGTIEVQADAGLGTQGEIEIVCPEASLALRLSARVRRESAGSLPGLRRISIEFERTLEGERLDRMARAGIIERRHFPRTAVSLMCEARPADGPERPLRVRVLDYSASGVQIVASEALEIGTPIYVCGESCPTLVTAAVTLRTVRRTQVDGDWLYGCVFDNRAGFYRFKNLVAEAEDQGGSGLALRLSWPFLVR